MFSTAIFDMDGLLLDSERPVRDAWFALALRHDLSLTDAIYLQCIGKNAVDTDAILSPVFEGAVSYRDACDEVERMLEREFAVNGYRAKPGVIDLLQWLRAAGIRCGVASSTDREEVIRRLQRAGLADFFDSISGGDEVSRGKPNPDLFLLAADRLQAPPQQCLVFEDSEFGAMGGLAAGMSVVLVPDLKIPAPAIQARCLTVLHSLEQSFPACEQWFATMRSKSGTS